MKNMSPDMLRAYTELAERLEAWPKERAALNVKRDELFREARGMGLSNSEIAARMEVSRTTVIGVLGSDDESTEEGEQ